MAVRRVSTEWWGHATGLWPTVAMLGVSVVCVAAAVGVSTSAGRLVGGPGVAVAVGAAFMIGAVLSGVLAAGTCRVAVRVSPYGVQIRHGLLPGPITSFPLRGIRHVRAVEVAPRTWGGWSWLWVPGRGRAVVVRSGPALEFTLSSGRTLVVSVDEPESAVAAVRRLRPEAGLRIV